MAAFTLQIGGGSAQDPEDLDITGAVLTTRLDARDELVLSAPLALDDATIIDPFVRVILRVSGTVRFIGWLDRPARAGSARSESAIYTLAGPWRWLAGTYYKGPNKVNGTVTAAASGAYTLGGDFDEADEPEKITIREQLTAVLDYAVAQTSSAFTYAALPSGFGEVQIPWEQRNDDRCADVIAALLAYIPTAVMWWTYSGTTPVLNFADTASASASHTLTETNLAAIPQLTPRYDLLYSTVEITYQESDGGQTVQSAASAGDAASLSAPFGIKYTFTLQTDEPVPTAGLAAKLAAWHQKLHIEANANFTAGLDFSHLPGELWGFGGIFSAFSAYSSVCQQIVRDLFFDRETVVLGIPAAPSTYQLSKRVRANNKNEPVDAPGGGGGTPTETGSLTIAITDPTDAPDFDAAECPWVATGPTTYSGKGETTITVEAGTYSVQFLPVAQVATGLWYVSASAPSVTITSGGGDTATGSYDTVQRFFARANGQETETGIDINAQDIVDLAPPSDPAGALMLKVREVDSFIDGEFLKVLIIAGEPYDPAA